MTLRDLLPPLDRPMLGFDLETTHTNAVVARIVELGIEIMIPDKPTKEYRTLVNPQTPIPAEATEIHGITDDMVKDAPTFAQLADNLLKGFTDADFCGYNVRFDLRILAAEFKRARRLWSYDRARIVDGFRLWQVAEARSLDDAVDRWITRETKDPHSLKRDQYESILREIQEAGKAHGALRDVKAATRVIAAQLASCPKLPRNVQHLHDICWPGWFDADGKLQWRKGQLCIMFGQHREKPLRQVPRDYLHWMATKGDFDELVKETCRAAIRGEYPEPVNTGIEDADDELS